MHIPNNDKQNWINIEKLKHYKFGKTQSKFNKIHGNELRLFMGQDIPPTLIIYVAHLT